MKYKFLVVVLVFSLIMLVTACSDDDNDLQKATVKDANLKVTVNLTADDLEAQMVTDKLEDRINVNQLSINIYEAIDYSQNSNGAEVADSLTKDVTIDTLGTEAFNLPSEKSYVIEVLLSGTVDGKQTVGIYQGVSEATEIIAEGSVNAIAITAKTQPAQSLDVSVSGLPTEVDGTTVDSRDVILAIPRVGRVTKNVTQDGIVTFDSQDLLDGSDRSLELKATIAYLTVKLKDASNNQIGNLYSDEILLLPKQSQTIGLGDKSYLGAIGEQNINVGNTLSLMISTVEPSGNNLTLSCTDLPADASFDSSSGVFTWTPSSSDVGSHQVTFNAEANGESSSETVTIVVNGVVTAVDDTAAVDEDDSIIVDVLANDLEADGGPISLINILPAGNGSVLRSGDGIAYTPEADWNGEDSFDYTISDNDGSVDTATVTVTVNSINDAPLAVDDTAEIEEDTIAYIEVLNNDSDVDGDTLTVVSFTEATNGTVENSIMANVIGSRTPPMIYTPDPNWYGEDSFSYTISDGNETATAVVNVTVTSVNDLPVIETIGAKTVELTNELTFTVNASDADGDDLTYSVSGDLTEYFDLATRTFAFTPTSNDQIGVYTLTINVDDGNGGTASSNVDIEVRSRAPVVGDDSATVDEDNPVTINLLDNDSDPDGDTITIASVDSPSNGTIVDNGDGTISYTPDPNWNGTESFAYTISDDKGRTATGTITVTVNGVADDPIVGDDFATVDEDNPVTINLLDNDSDPDGDTITIASVDSPSSGTVVDNGDGTITYIPDPNWNGTESFAYTISDSTGRTATGTITVTVTSVEDYPIATADSAVTDEDTSVTINVLTNDNDPDGEAVIVSQIYSPANGNAVDNGDGTITYTPDLNWNGEDSFGYVIEDESGDSAMMGESYATVTVTVNPVDDPPTMNAIGDKSINEAEVLSFTVTATDVDSTVTYSASGLPSGAEFDTTTGAFTWMPTYQQSGSYSLSFSAESNGESVSEDITITVSDAQHLVVIGRDIASADDVARKLDDSRNSVWTFNNNYYFAKGVAVNSRGYTYVGEGNGYLHKIDGAGNTVWSSRYDFSNIKDIEIDGSDNVYFIESSTIYKIDSSGNQLWTFTGHSDYIEGLALDATEDYLYSVDRAETLKKIDTATGNEEASNNAFSSYDLYSVAVDSANNVYVGDLNGNIFKLDSSLALSTTLEFHSEDVDEIVIDSSDNIYTASHDGNVKKINSSGTVQWTFSGHTEGVYDIALDEAEEYIYTVSLDNTLRKISTTDGTGEVLYTANDNLYGVAIGE